MLSAQKFEIKAILKQERPKIVMPMTNEISSEEIVQWMLVLELRALPYEQKKTFVQLSARLKCWNVSLNEVNLKNM